MKRPVALTVLGLLGMGASGAPAHGQSLAPRDFDQDIWRFSITPYLFLPVRTTGTSTVAGQDVDLDLDLSDVFKALNMAFSARGEAWKGDFGLIVDGYYVAIGGDASVSLPGPDAGSAGADVDIKQGIVDLATAYRVAKGRYDDDGNRYAFDLQAGARYNSLTQDVDTSFDAGSAGGFQQSLGGTEDWWEPVVGARGMAEINERWTGSLLADFSGFGVNGDDLQWKVRLGLDYRPWERTSLRFGWQFYGIDYSTERDDGTFAYDVFQTGPALALTFQFQ